VTFDDGRYVASAVAAAKAADVVVVFGNQWMGEGEDAPDLSLPDGQDALIAAVTAANPNSIVVLQTGGRGVDALARPGRRGRRGLVFRRQGR
jgi:beta-glucosidase